MKQQRAVKGKKMDPKKPHCPMCRSYQVLYGKRAKLFWCRICGHDWEDAKDKVRIIK